jgi:4-hydroxybutyrate CoA-transferase
MKRGKIFPYIGKADYTPVLLSQTIRLYDEKIIPVDVALLTVSPPDQQGYCSLGVSVEMSSAAARNSNIIIGIGLFTK